MTGPDRILISATRPGKAERRSGSNQPLCGESRGTVTVETCPERVPGGRPAAERRQQSEGRIVIPAADIERARKADITSVVNAAGPWIEHARYVFGDEMLRILEAIEGASAP